VIEVTGISPDLQNNRAIVTSKIDVKNQHGMDVMTYTAVRMMAGEK